jgi:hypothetical protein
MTTTSTGLSDRLRTALFDKLRFEQHKHHIEEPTVLALLLGHAIELHDKVLALETRLERLTTFGGENYVVASSAVRK